MRVRVQPRIPQDKRQPAGREWASVGRRGGDGGEAGEAGDGKFFPTPLVNLDMVFDFLKGQVIPRSKGQWENVVRSGQNRSFLGRNDANCRSFIQLYVDLVSLRRFAFPSGLTGGYVNHPVGSGVAESMHSGQLRSVLVGGEFELGVPRAGERQQAVAMMSK